MSNKRLELTWIGKEQRPRLEPRILLEDPELSYHAVERVTDNDIFDNRLIFGDNLLALKALEQEFSGKVKCVFIDPPYNTGSAFEHYDDGLEHSIWLGMMRDRLELLARLLSADGSIWITIDDNEAHYLKVVCDEVLGRRNFIANVIWQKRTSRENRAAFSVAHDHLLVYAKMPSVLWKSHRNLLPSTEVGFSNPDGDPRGPWRSIPFTAQGYRPNQMYDIETPTGTIQQPPKGRCWAATEPVYKQHLSNKRVYFPRSGDGKPRIKVFAGEELGLVPSTIWESAFAGDTEQAKKEMLSLYPDGELFDTPKPEELIQRIFEVGSKPGDLVLDSFAGSGTTGAVAHKMGRRWIMVELGEHCHTHIIPRLKKVIDGSDEGGISKTVNWKGGGGFRYYKLAPSLLKQDKYRQWVVNDAYNADMLAEAMCKHMGFEFSPSTEFYWMHGSSTETDFIFVTAQTLTHEALAHLSEEVGDIRTLLVCCSAWNGNTESFANLTLTKIPNAILARCEFGHDDYSLQVQNLPMRQQNTAQPPNSKTARDTQTLDLFTANDSNEEAPQ